MRRSLRAANLGVVWAYVALFAMLAVASPAFRTLDNVGNLLAGFSHIGILAIGITFPLLLGGIDLSVGSIIGLVGMVAFDATVVFGLPGWAAIVLGLAVGIAGGILNAFLIIRLRLQPFVATLSTMVLYRGIIYGISARQLFGQTGIKAIDDPLYHRLDGSVAGIPVPFLLLIGVVLAAQYVITQTRFGVELRAVGGNPAAARLAGLGIERIHVLAYAACGAAAAVTGLILTARLQTSPEDLGVSFELSAIAAAVIGGVAINGGVGNAVGPAVGAMLIGTLYVGLTLLGVTTYAQPIAAGLLLAGAVAYDRYSEIGRARVRRMRSREARALEGA